MTYDVIIIGAGPGGIFSAYELMQRRPEWKVAVLEAGNPLEKRHCPIDGDKVKSCIHCKTCAIMNGFGGAGAFSDGKLNTGTKDLRHRFILETLVRCGAPDTILTDAKPHVGTDMLHIALKNMRNELTALGADIRFGHKLTGVSAENGQLSALTVEGPEGAYTLPCRQPERADL